MKCRGIAEACFIVVMVLLVVVGQASGAGFALYEGSARGNALGGGLVARGDDPSALFFNPAGITQLPGLQVMAGATAIVPKTDVVIDGKTYSTQDNVWVPSHFYLTYQLNESVWLGLAAFSPFGLGTEFDSSWPGAPNNYDANIKTLTLNPTLAFKITDTFSAAVGMDFMWFDLDLKNTIPVAIPTVGTLTVDQDLAGDSYGYGFNLGLHYKPCRYAAIGVSYRSQVTQSVSGDADFAKPELLSLLAPSIFNDTDASGTITLPDMVFLGVAFYPTDKLSFEVGGVWNRWSTYDALTIKYENAITVNPITGRPVTQVTRIKDWKDTWRLNVSAEYKALPWLDLRAGYVYDEEPSLDEHVDYLVPANDRHLFSFGPGFHWDRWTLDLSYTYLHIKDRDVAARPADSILASKFEEGDAHLMGMSLGYKF